jgi:ribosomal protein S24E
MKSTKLSEVKNPFLDRTEVVVEFSSDVIPSKADVIKELGVDESLVVVKKVDKNFGRQVFVADVVIYDSVASREKVEVIPQKVRKKMEEERKKAEEEAKKKAEEEAKAAEEAKKAEEEAKAAEEAKKAEEEAKNADPTEESVTEEKSGEAKE